MTRLLRLHRVLSNSQRGWWTSYLPHKILEVKKSPAPFGPAPVTVQQKLMGRWSLHRAVQSILLSNALEQSPDPSFPPKSMISWNIISAWLSGPKVEVNC